MNKPVYIISYVKDIDPFERPLCVCSSIRAVSKFIGIPKSTAIDNLGGCNTYAVFGKYQVEKIFLDSDRV